MVVNTFNVHNIYFSAIVSGLLVLILYLFVHYEENDNEPECLI
jgi:hypothetical protein